jgi:hypothetical protein
MFRKSVLKVRLLLIIPCLFTLRTIDISAPQERYRKKRQTRYMPAEYAWFALKIQQEDIFPMVCAKSLLQSRPHKHREDWMVLSEGDTVWG